MSLRPTSFRGSALALLVAPALAAVLARCGSQGPPPPPEETITVPRGGRVTIYVEAPRRNAAPILKSFTELSDIEVHAVYRETLQDRFLPSLKAEASAGAVDLFWGTSPLPAIELARAGLAIPFRPAGARPVPTQFHDRAFRWIGFAVNPRVILYNVDRIKRAEAPVSIEEMAAGPWAGRGAVARIRSGAAAYQAAALFALWGPERAGAFFDSLGANGTLIVDDDAAVRQAVSSGKAAWGIVGLDEAICANREAEPVHIIFPDRLSFGAVVAPYVIALLRGGPHPAQAKGLYGFLFASESAFQLGKGDCAVMTLLPDIPKPDWVPSLGSLNVTLLDNDAAFDAFRTNASFFESWGSSGAPARARQDAAGHPEEPGGTRPPTP